MIKGMSYWAAPDVIENNYINNIDDKKIKSLINYVCKNHGITILQLQSKKRNREIVECRHEIFYILHKVYKVRSIKVGSLFNRDHSTVLHSCKTVSNFIEIDKKYENHMSNLINNFRSYYSTMQNNNQLN